MKNQGFDRQKEDFDSSPKDHQYGSVILPCLTDIKEDEREAYLPAGEVQRGVEDMQDCATRGPLNIYETKFNWLIRNKKLSADNLRWLQRNGYITERGVEFSDAWVAIGSGTTRQGNSLKAPLDFIYNSGLLPKSVLPLKPWMTFDEYHDPERITDEMEALAREFNKRFLLNYGKVYTHEFEHKLKEDMLVVAGYAWPDPVEGTYLRVEDDFNHCFILFKRPMSFAFDNYIDPVDGDFVKRLAPDYNFMQYGYQLIVRENEIRDIVEDTKENVWIDLWRRIGAFLRGIFKIPCKP
jgi:hypothetical protein